MEPREIQEKAEAYMQSENNDFFRKEILKLLDAENWTELSERLYKDLEFGTGGIRGIIGGGFNRINPFVIARATQGLSAYVKKAGKLEGGSAVIAYDSRHYSEVFAETAAEVLCGNGIRVYLFSGLRPTPELSYAVRKLVADTGIVITASHNPKNYNGYKAYWSDGGQVTPPHDKGIIEEVLKAKDILRMSKEKAFACGMLTLIDKEIDDAYIAMAVSHCINKDVIERQKHTFISVFTPLHGAGKKSVEDTFSRLGIPLLTVPEQAEPDGDFPTVEYPNPEEASALSMAVALAKRAKADLVLGADPDSDRLGLAVPSGEGDEWVLLNGNQTGSLLADYILSSLKKKNRLPEKAVLIKTIVTTELQRKIGESYGAKVLDVLTGFKYIAEKIRQFETTGEVYIFGGEESYGYLVGTEVRDKDAVSAAAMAAEMAMCCKDRGISVLDYLKEIYKKFGYYNEILVSKTFPGREGMKAMKNFMENLRNTPLKEIAKLPVMIVKDYKKSEHLDMKTGAVLAIDLPASDVMQFSLTDDTLISVRPSGTEPKLKFYASACSPVSGKLEDAMRIVAEKLTKVREDIEKMVDAVNPQETV